LCVYELEIIECRILHPEVMSLIFVYVLPIIVIIFLCDIEKSWLF